MNSTLRLQGMSEDMLARSRDLANNVKDAIALRVAMNPVDRALEYVDQRQSFVKGMVSHSPDFSEDPMSILANEVRRLRSELKG